MTDKTKKIAVTISGVALAIAMGLQTFVFGKSDLQILKQEVAILKTAVKDCCGR